jgi:hypothetical protein
MSSSSYRIVLGILTLVHKKCDAGSWVSEFFHKIGEGVYKASLSSTTLKETYSHIENDDEYCKMFLSAKKKELLQKFRKVSSDDLLTKQVDMYIEMLEELEEAFKNSDNEQRIILKTWLDELFPSKNKTLYRWAEWMVPFSFFLQKDREDFFNDPEGSRIKHYLFFLESIGDLLRSNGSFIPWTTFENMIIKTAGFHGVLIDRAVMEQTKIRLLFTSPPSKKN